MTNISTMVAPPANPGDQIITVITPHSSGNYLFECWRQRELLWFFARRDLMVRYRQTLLGVAWVLLRPLMAMGVFGFLFGTVAKLNYHGLPPALVILVGMLPWQFFASVLSEGANSVANNPALVTKVYFPRLLMPASGLMLNTVDLLVGFGFLAMVMVWYGLMPPWQVVFAPLSFVLMAAIALGAALWLSALAVRYRDFRAVVPIMLQFGILLTPVGFTVAALPEHVQQLARINPLTGPVEWLRWCVLPGTIMPGPKTMALSAAGAAILLFSGFWFFRKAEARFADII